MSKLTAINTGISATNNNQKSSNDTLISMSTAASPSVTTTPVTTTATTTPPIGSTVQMKTTNNQIVYVKLIPKSASSHNTNIPITSIVPQTIRIPTTTTTSQSVQRIHIKSASIGVKQMSSKRINISSTGGGSGCTTTVTATGTVMQTTPTVNVINSTKILIRGATAGSQKSEPIEPMKVVQSPDVKKTAENPLSLKLSVSKSDSHLLRTAVNSLSSSGEAPEPTKSIDTTDDDREIMATNDPKLEGKSKEMDRERTSTPKTMRELKELQKSLNESKILTEFIEDMSMSDSTKVRKAKKIIKPPTEEVEPIIDTDETRSRSNSRSSSRPSVSDDPQKRNMRSQNADFTAKQQRFLKKLQLHQKDGSDYGTDDTEEESNEPEEDETNWDRSVGLGESIGDEDDNDKDEFNPNVAPKPGWDKFCWYCHKGAALAIACFSCKRSYHRHCLESKKQANNMIDADWYCPECTEINEMRFKQRNDPPKYPFEMLCKMLQFALNRLKKVKGAEQFHKIEPTTIANYEKYVTTHIDLAILKDKVVGKKYSTTLEFLSDTKWILHNCNIHSPKNGKLINVARSIVLACKQEMYDIDTCYECYFKANTRGDNWFVEVCSKPHLLLWAKVKGYPHWPAKAMHSSHNSVDVRFFGDHDRASIPIRDCYLFSLTDPNPTSRKSKANSLAASLVEVEIYIKNIESKYGTFKPAIVREPFDPHKDQLGLMIPNINKRIDEIIKPVSDIIVSPSKSDLTFKIVKSADNHLSMVKKSDTIPISVTPPTGSPLKSDADIKPPPTTPTTTPKKSVSSTIAPEKTSAEIGSPSSVEKVFVENLSTSKLTENNEIVKYKIDETPPVSKQKDSTTEVVIKLAKQPTTKKVQISNPKSNLTSVAVKVVQKRKRSLDSSLPEKVEKIKRLKLSKEKDLRREVLNPKGDTETREFRSNRKRNQSVHSICVTSLEKAVNSNETIPEKVAKHEKHPDASITQHKEKTQISKEDEIVKDLIQSIDDTMREPDSPVEIPSSNSKLIEPTVLDTTVLDTTEIDATVVPSNATEVNRTIENQIVDRSIEAIGTICKGPCEEPCEVPSKEVVKRFDVIPFIEIKQEMPEQGSDSTAKEATKTRSILVQTELNSEKTGVCKNTSINSDPLEVTIKDEPTTDDDNSQMDQTNEARPRSLNLVVASGSGMTATPIEPSVVTKGAITVRDINQMKKPPTTACQNIDSAVILKRRNQLSILKAAQKKISTNASLTFTQRARKTFPSTVIISQTKPSATPTSIHKTITTVAPTVGSLRVLNNMVYIPVSGTTTGSVVKDTKTIKTTQPPPLTSVSNGPLPPGRLSTTHSTISNVETISTNSTATTLPAPAAINSGTVTVSPVVSNNRNNGNCSPPPLSTISSDTAIAQDDPAVTSEASTSATHMMSGVTESLASAITDVLARPPPLLAAKPTGAVNSNGDHVYMTPLPNSVRQRLMDNTHKMVDFFRAVIEDTVSNFALTPPINLEARVAHLELENERLRQTHEKEMTELKTNTDVILCEMRKSVDKERSRLISEIRKQCELERIRSVEETKKKQWCTSCGKEAQFYCCWNTSYCDYQCQQRDWPRHMAKCAQIDDINCDPNAQKVGVKIVHSKNNSNRPMTNQGPSPQQTAKNVQTTTLIPVQKRLYPISGTTKNPCFTFKDGMWMQSVTTSDASTIASQQQQQQASLVVTANKPSNYSAPTAKNLSKNIIITSTVGGAGNLERLRITPD